MKNFNIKFLLKYCWVMFLTTTFIVGFGTAAISTSILVPTITRKSSPIEYPQVPITYKELAHSAAKLCNTPPKIYHFLIQTESGWNSKAVSSTNAQGLAQLMPRTARSLLVSNSFNPNDNLIGGACYLSSLIVKYNGNVRKALYAYNTGPGNVAKGRIGPSTKKYAEKIIRQANNDTELNYD